MFSARPLRSIGRVINSGLGVYCYISLAKPITASGATITVGSATGYNGGSATPVFTGEVTNVAVSGNLLMFVLVTSNQLPSGEIYLVELANTSITLT